MPHSLLNHITEGLLYLMQVSIILPMAVVWRRRRFFSAPVRLLSWYVYLSAICALAARLGALYLHNNLFVLIGFNILKMMLFAAVYAQVLTSARLRRLLQWFTASGLVLVVCIAGLNQSTATDVARVTQCAVLAGFALAYLEQSLNRRSVAQSFHDPLWLLSVGQLLYSAGTVTAFSVGNMHMKGFLTDVVFFCVALFGLVFNSFLTLAFWRAQPDSALAVEAAYEPAQLLGS